EPEDRVEDARHDEREDEQPDERVREEDVGAFARAAALVDGDARRDGAGDALGPGAALAVDRDGREAGGRWVAEGLRERVAELLERRLAACRERDDRAIKLGGKALLVDDHAAAARVAELREGDDARRAA